MSQRRKKEKKMWKKTEKEEEILERQSGLVATGHIYSRNIGGK
jgi:hypothetical protein